MEKKYHFTKDNTLAIKGIAIIFLLFYHCFSRTSRFVGIDINFWPLSQDRAVAICFQMQICVGMFAFLSAYGLALSMKKRFKDYQFRAQEVFCYVTERYMKVFFLFLLPFLFCQIVTELLDVSRYGGGRFHKLICMTLDALGISNIFGSKMLVDTWWYLSLVVLITVFLPACIQIYKRFGWLFIPMVMIAGSMFLERNVNLTKWLFTIPIAVCFADRQVLERLKAWRIVRNPVFNKILKFVLMTAAFLIMCKVRTHPWGQQHMEFALNGIVPVFFIWWCYEFVIELPVVKQILCFFGRHSANIFYVHTLIRSLWLKEMTYSFEYAILIWGFLMAASLAVSLFLETVRKWSGYNRLTGRMILWVQDWLKRVGRDANEYSV